MRFARKIRKDGYAENGLPLQSGSQHSPLTHPAPGGLFSFGARQLPAQGVEQDDDGDACFYDTAGLDPLTECSDEQLQEDPAGALRAAASELESFAALTERFRRAGWEVVIELDDDDEWQLTVTAPEGMSDEDALSQERLLAGPLVERFDEFAPEDEEDEPDA
jgi:hypothetical protein